MSEEYIPKFLWPDPYHKEHLRVCFQLDHTKKALEKAKAMIRSASTDWPSLIETIEKIETGFQPGEKK